ncbi:Transcriptional regulator, HxlR family protein [Streptomyces sp. PVA_94-07]|nr:Transcriptional regulator, HxlR family protein [Streptomyces sp. PVA_94-07]
MLPSPCRRTSAWTWWAQNLRMLERNGLVERCVHPTVPPRVDYTLTEPGLALRETTHLMCAWTQRYLGPIEGARGRFEEGRGGAGLRVTVSRAGRARPGRSRRPTAATAARRPGGRRPAGRPIRSRRGCTCPC